METSAPRVVKPPVDARFWVSEPKPNTTAISKSPQRILYLRPEIMEFFR